ncbi:MAG: hypothetical protein AAFR16_12005 [Pseudomonadota bacterium]
MRLVDLYQMIAYPVINHMQLFLPWFLPPWPKDVIVALFFLLVSLVRSFVRDAAPAEGGWFGWIGGAAQLTALALIYSVFVFAIPYLNLAFAAALVVISALAFLWLPVVLLISLGGRRDPLESYFTGAQMPGQQLWGAAITTSLLFALSTLSR